MLCIEGLELSGSNRKVGRRRPQKAPRFQREVKRREGGFLKTSIQRSQGLTTRNQIQLAEWWICGQIVNGEHAAASDLVRDLALVPLLLKIPREEIHQEM